MGSGGPVPNKALKTQVEPKDAERFEEGIESDFQDAEEATTRETDGVLETENRGPGESTEN